MSAQLIRHNFRLHPYLKQMSEKGFDQDQLSRLAVLMARSVELHDQLETIYEEAIAVLEEDQVADDMERWSFDAIYNQYQLAAIQIL